MAVLLRYLMALLLLIGLTAARDGQERPGGPGGTLPFEHLTVEDGLSQSTVLRIIQDRQGFLWFGTGDGLNKYDGYDFTVYKHNPDDPNSPGGNYITALYEAPSEDGVLWVGYHGAGLTRFDSRAGTFTNYKADPDTPGSLRSDNIIAVYEDRAGTLWVGTDQGLHRLDPETGAFTVFEHELENPQSLSDNIVTSILEDRSGALWVGTMQGGLNRFDPEAEAFDQYRHDEADTNSIGSDGISALYEDAEGTLWVGTLEGGVNRFDAETQTFTPYKHDPSDAHTLSSNIVTTLGAVPTEPGVLWVGTAQNGLNRLDVETGAVTRYPREPGNPKSLRDNTVLSVFGDPSGVLWVGTALGGVSRVNVATASFAHFKNDPDDANSLGDNIIWSVHEDRDGIVWVGTTRGLDRLDRDAGTVDHFAHDPNNARSLSHDWVRAIHEDQNGMLWLGSHVGLDRLDRRAGTITRVALDADSVAYNAVVSIKEDRAGLLWLGTMNAGLIRFDPADGSYTRFLHDPDDPYSLSSDRVITVYEAKDGTLWVGTWDGGLNKLDRDNETFTRYVNEPGNANSLSHNTVLTIHEDAAGTLWIGTYGGGLNCFHPQTGDFVHFTEQNSDLPTNTITGILGDDAGTLWLSTHNGLSRFDPQTQVFRNYGAERGVQSREFNAGAYHKGRQGALFFGGVNGVNVFFPDQITDNREPPRVVLTGLKIRNEIVVPGEDSPLEAPLASAQALTLSHRENDLAFDYVGLHFASPAHNRYAYMLEGFDDDWRVVDAQRSAAYTNIPPGEYVFRVKAANSDGVWNETGAALAVTIRPPWWKTLWAYAFYGLFAMLGVVAIDRVQRRRVIGKERARTQIREAQLQAAAAEAQAQLLKTENERQVQELEEARQLQLSMLPRVLPAHPRVDIAAFMKTATEVGGDYYDFNMADDGTLTVAIGDATGHGSNAGTMVTATKGIFNVLAEEPDLVAVLYKSTRALKQMGLRKLYMALALAKLTGDTLELAGAGMPPALIYRAASGAVEEVPLKGMPLGSFVDFPYQKATLHLAPGDTVLLMSDGFPEMFNAEGEMFGYEQTRAIFEEVAARTPQEVVDHFAAASRAFANGSSHRDDDMTFVVMKVKA